MKTKQWLFAALTALLMAGCSTESDLTRLDEDVNPPVPEGMTRLSFEVKGVRTGSSYATTALTPEESQLKDMIVMLFPQGAGGKPLPDDKATVLLKAKVGKTALGAPTAAVLIDKSVPEGTYYAVIVANTAACFNGALDFSDETVFNGFAEGVKGTTYSDLFNNRSSGSTLPYYGYREELSVVDYGLAMKSLVTGIKVAALADRGDDIALTATMKRPMARFDIKNSAWESFTVTGYGASNIRPDGDLCPAPDDVPDWANISISDLPRQNYNAARINQINNPTDHDNNPATPAVIDYRSAFYLCPGLATDGSVVEIYGDLEIGGKTMPLTVKLPLVTGTPPTTTPIAITANKRYKIELTLSQTNDDVVGNVVLDEGAWDEGDGTGTGGDNIEQKLPGEILDPSTGTTYTNVDATNGTFTAPDGATEFSFRLVATANTIKAADGADAGIITNVEGAATLAPSTTYKITMDATGSTGKLIEVGQDKDGKPVTVKTYTVNRKEIVIPDNIYPPTMTEATLLNGLYWAPVNVGATSPDEPGSLFQYGRLSSWSSADAAVATKEYRQISIADAEAADNKNVYLCNDGGSERNWWTDGEGAALDAMFARWKGVSDGRTHPCPKGWRLPTVAEVQVIADVAKEDIVFTSLSSGKKATMLGISLIVKEAIRSWRLGEVATGRSFYWLAAETSGRCSSLRIDSSFGFAIDEDYSSSSGGNGYSIRCVRTKP